MGKLFVLLILLAGCSSSVQNFTDVSGNPCRATKVWTTAYTAETHVSCMENGQATTVNTEHTDISMLYGFIAALGPLIALAL